MKEIGGLHVLAMCSHVGYVLACLARALRCARVCVVVATGCPAWWPRPGVGCGCSRRWPVAAPAFWLNGGVPVRLVSWVVVGGVLPPGWGGLLAVARVAAWCPRFCLDGSVLPLACGVRLLGWTGVVGSASVVGAPLVWGCGREV